MGNIPTTTTHARKMAATRALGPFWLQKEAAAVEMPAKEDITGALVEVQAGITTKTTKEVRASRAKATQVAEARHHAAKHGNEA